MGGQPSASPLPRGDALDEAGGPTMGEILAAADSPSPLTPHEIWAEHLRGAIAGNRPVGRSVLELYDPPAAVAEWVQRGTGRALGHAPTWIRFRRPDLERGALFLISNLHPSREAELTVFADPGVITRSVIRDVCRWAFYGLGLWRVVIRVPEGCADLADLARRAKFRFEGTSRGFYGGVIDAQVWAMCGMDCPWLPPLPSPAPPIDIHSPVNVKAC